ncbi:MAG: hypothetical protein HYS76_00665, partial [Candidatus Wildermuthbacteria bacterium]|nr:hypothetical protein [Candidatus Wildermuthbacteria bacterium]
TADTYVNRDISWYGEEYAGFSIPNHYPIEELQPIDYDKTAKQDIRLAYVACEQDNGPDRNCDLRENAKTGSCRRAGFACGAPNALGNRGICVNPGGVGAVPLCVYGIDGSSAPAQPEAKPRRESNVLARALPAEQCRAYPEGDSPFPADVSDWTQSGLPLGRKAGFAQANICEKFAWIDRDGDGARDTKPEWPDPRAELIPQDCECDYSKAIYNGKAFTKYFGLEEGNVPQGICQGGPRSGELCAPEAKFNEKKDSRDPENLKTCGPQTQGGICQRIERIDKVVGLSGQCLERDLSLSLNGIPQNYACLTWNPLGIVPGGVDIYNQYAAAGYAPTGSTGRYFCVEAEGQAGNVNQSYEAMYTRDLGDFNIGADAANVRDAQGNRPEGDNGQFYREEFLTAGYIASDNADNRDLGLYEKDIAAIRLTTSHDFRDQDNTEEDAIKKAIEDGANILSRTGRTGITAEGRLYWEATFNIPSGTGVEKLFLNEDLAQKAVLGEGGGRQTKNDVSGCSNTVPGNMYFAVRALFDASPARKFLGMWTSFCDGRNDHDIAFLLDATVHYAEPCVAIARVEGSNAAFTDRVWSGAGYQASNENISVNNLSNSPYGDEDENTYREFFMLGYGYEQRNTPWGSAVSTQEPFGAEAWQVNGPEGYGSPYLKYIPAAPDAGSPYGCFSRRKGVSDDGILAGMSCGALGRCAAAPTSFGASISKNEGNLCQNRSSCPLQSVCSNSINTVCSTDTECRALPGAPADAFCSAKHCGNDEDNYTTEVCKEDDDCNLEGYTCKDELAFAECTDQFRTFGIGGRHCDYGGLLGPRGTANCESDQDCPGTINGRRGTCIANDVPSDKQSPLEFLFAKSFGIWRWRPTEGSATIGQCIGGTPVDGNACADNADCSQAGGACVPQNICNGGPLSGALNCSVNADCQGQNPDGVNRTICSRGADEFASLTCQGGPNNGEKCTRDVGERGVGCYSDNAVCSAGFCNGGAFENSIMTTPPCPSGWQEIGGRCRLSCANNNECRYGRSTCGATSQCNDGSGILAGLPCANNSQCNYSGSCRSTTITQPAGYQKIQDGAGASIGWDNREEATLNEQPFAPVIGSPDISACDLQSQKCRLQGLAIGINDFDCGASSDCPTGWTCGARTTFGGGGDTSGSTCVPPRGIDANALSINNRVSGELRAAGSYRAILRFYAWADHNTMPITSRSVDWGDGLVEKTVDSKYKNHKPTCSAGDTDDGAAKECGGMPGLTCAKQADCPAGTGLCVPVGRCSSSRTRCAVNEDCPLGGNGVERCVLSRFGNSPDACDEQYFEFEHTYVCNRELMSRLPDCVGADLDPTNKNAPHTACARDLDGNGSADSCLFRPKVQVRDNWGYCNGICPSVGRDGSPGGLRCYESECDAHPGAWTGFGGFITITPRN